MIRYTATDPAIGNAGANFSVARRVQRYRFTHLAGLGSQLYARNPSKRCDVWKFKTIPQWFDWAVYLVHVGIPHGSVTASVEFVPDASKIGLCVPLSDDVILDLQLNQVALFASLYQNGRIYIFPASKRMGGYTSFQPANEWENIHLSSRQTNV